MATQIANTVSSAISTIKELTQQLFSGRLDLSMLATKAISVVADISDGLITTLLDKAENYLNEKIGDIVTKMPDLFAKGLKAISIKSPLVQTIISQVAAALQEPAEEALNGIVEAVISSIEENIGKLKTAEISINEFVEAVVNDAKEEITDMV